MPDFVQAEIRAIDDQLRVLKDEAARLEAARAALTGGPRRRGRPAINGAARTPARPASRRNDRAPAPRPRRGGSTRANQALELVRERPGITIPEIAKAMKIEPNYLYCVLPRLASDGQVKRDGQGWHPSSSTSTTAQPVGNALNASGPVPLSPRRRHPQLAPRGLSELQHRHRRPTAAGPRARPRPQCSPRSREERR
jgi:hypothetical protein